MFIMYTAFVDGGCRPNPGKGSYGVILYNKFMDEIYRENGLVGKYVTNNIAEYTAVLKALEIAASYGIQNIEIRSDSELVVKQLNGQYQVNDQGLKKLYNKAKKISKNFGSVLFTHIPRKQNLKADNLATEFFEELDNRRIRAQELAKNSFLKINGTYIFMKEDSFYYVDHINLTCTCLDQKNRGGLCKHLMAVQIIEQKIKDMEKPRTTQRYEDAFC